jgi:hypothetical protein
MFLLLLPHLAFSFSSLMRPNVPTLHPYCSKRHFLIEKIEETYNGNGNKQQQLQFISPETVVDNNGDGHLHWRRHSWHLLLLSKRRRNKLDPLV